jgi:hypothetical protein
METLISWFDDDWMLYTCIEMSHCAPDMQLKQFLKALHHKKILLGGTLSPSLVHDILGLFIFIFCF